MLKNFVYKKKITELSEPHIASVMCSYSIAMKRDDGTNYELSSINNFSSLIGKWLKDNGMAEIDGDVFMTYQEDKEVKLKLLKKDKKGNRPNRAEPVTFEEEDTL